MSSGFDIFFLFAINSNCDKEISSDSNWSLDDFCFLEELDDIVDNLSFSLNSSDKDFDLFSSSILNYNNNIIVVFKQIVLFKKKSTQKI